MIEFVKQYIQGIASGLTLLGAVYLVFWIILGKKLGNRKIQLSKRAGWPQIKGEVIAALVSGLGSTVLMLFLISLKDNGTLKFFTETNKYGVGYEVLTVIVLLLVSDTWFYWSHRIMHHPRIYKYVHALHHKSLDVNPFTAQSFHVIEAMWLTGWLIPLAMMMPISMSALGVMQVLGMLNNLKSHLGYELFPGFFSKVPPFNMLVTATNHSLHHTQYNGNYGLFFRYWDIWCGTELNTTTNTFNEIHTRKDAVLIDNTKYKTLTISKLVKETADTVSVYFNPTDKLFYDYEAGQQLTVRVKVQGRNHDRCFSISSTPTDDFLRITVKLKGEVSHWLYNDAKVGDTIESLFPVGDFTIGSLEKLNNNYVMIAGGSGITPIYSMIRDVLQQNSNSKIVLLYANKSEDSIIFKDEINTLAKQFTNLKVQYFLSGQKRIGAEDLAINTGAHYYVCGPDGLKDSVFGILKSSGVNKYNIHTEHFVDGYVSYFGLI
jgi:ring-1,2-phenylacetyl-CoA epoxidase subunit PaaE